MPATGGAPDQRRDMPVTPQELVPGTRWQRVFPGEERQLGVIRRWLASLLPDSPARDDLAVVATELGTNAIRHTASGQGGWLVVEITWHGPVVRVTVADNGGPTEPRVIDDPAAEHGRGLLLVRGLSLRTGVCGDHRGRLVWADLLWESTSPATRVTAGDPHEAAIRDGEAALARRFAGVPAWFGRSTLAWWALPGNGGLVSAPSADDLAALLGRLESAPESLAGGQPGEADDERPGVGPGREPGGVARRAEPGARSRTGDGGRPGGRDRRGSSCGTAGGRPGRARMLHGGPHPVLGPASLTSGAA